MSIYRLKSILWFSFWVEGSGLCCFKNDRGHHILSGERRCYFFWLVESDFNGSVLSSFKGGFYKLDSNKRLEKLLIICDPLAWKYIFKLICWYLSWDLSITWNLLWIHWDHESVASCWEYQIQSMIMDSICHLIVDSSTNRVGILVHTDNLKLDLYSV